MPQNFYALLVGIDDYPDPDSQLNGCVNDIKTFEAYLRERARRDENQLQLKVLLNEAATRRAVIDSFREHLGQAGSDEVALFYYAGHGSQQHTPKELWELEPDRKDETLVCWDSRTPGSWDLADKELGKLISEVAEKEPHVVIILDCCHSGSGTRGPGELAVRKIKMDDRKRPIDTFIFAESDAKLVVKTRGVGKSEFDWPKGRHLLLAACHERERASEWQGDDNKPCGAFSYFLMKALRQAKGSLTYRDLFKRANTLLRSNLSGQSPQFEATESADLNLPFLSGAITDSKKFYTASYHDKLGWVIDAGAVHDIPMNTGGESTTLALFPLDTESAKLNNLSNAVAHAEVIEVLPHLSRIFPLDGANLEIGKLFKAIVTSLATQRLPILFDGDDSALDFVRQSLTRAQKAANLVCEVKEIKEAKYMLLAKNKEYGIFRIDDERAITKIKDYSRASADRVIQLLERIAEWHRIANLSNPTPVRLHADDIRIEAHRITGRALTRSPNSRVETELIWPNDSEQQAGEVRLHYEKKNGRWEKPQVQVKLINQSESKATLYCALLALADDYTISSLLPGGSVRLKHGQETNVRIAFDVSETQWQAGITEGRDLLKVIASTQEFDVTLLQQDKPAVRGSKRSAEPPKPKGTVNRLMSQNRTRGTTVLSADQEAYDDWMTNEISVITVRPKEAVAEPIRTTRLR